MKSKILFLVFISSFLFGKVIAQNNTDSSDAAAEAIDGSEDQEEGAYIDYSTTKLDAPIYSLGLNIITMPLGKRQSFGGGASAKINLRTNQAIGLNIDYMGSSIDEDYGYIVGEPKLLHWNVGAFYEYTFLMEHNFQASFRMHVGVSGFDLKDDSIKEIYTWYDEYGNAYQDERAITIDKNIFLRLAPGINLNYKVTPNISVEAQATYDFYVGNPNFGKLSAFNNYMIGAGVVFRLNPGR